MSEPASSAWGDRPQTVWTSPPRRATAAFMRQHPARWIALGFGSGLSPIAPGTVGTLWAWVAFLVLDPWLNATGWAGLGLVTFSTGWILVRQGTNKPQTIAANSLPNPIQD